MPVTTSSIIPASGSSRKPHVTRKRPMPSRVASGICGIQSATLMSNARASAGSPRSCQNANSDSPSAAVIVAHATTPAVLRENARIPITPLISAPAPGKRGINQIYRINPPACPPARPAWPARSARLPSHQVHFVDVDRLFVAIEGEDDAESYRRLGGRHGDDEDREDLADGVLQLRRERDQVDVDRIEDQLDRHEDDDDVVSDQHSHHADQ